MQGAIISCPISFRACVPQVLQHEGLKSFRFFVGRDELIAFPGGIGSVQDGQFVPQTRVSRAIGGIGHGAALLDAGRTAYELGAIRQGQALAELDGLPGEELVQAACATPGAVVIRAEELSRARIQDAGMWFALLRGFRCAAILKLGYANFGTLALPSLTDARRAVEGLRGLLGGALEVDLPWGPRR